MGFYTYHNIDDPLTIRYVALGKQKQWGFADTNRSTTITYPISFSSQTLRVIPVVQMNNRNSGYDRSPFFVASTAKTNFVTALAGDAITWVAFGR